MLVAVPVQIVCDEGEAVITGVGLTVTSRLKGVPTQPVGPVGVITYLTVPAEIPVLTSTWLIAVPQPELQLLNPVIVPLVGIADIDATHVKVVPAVEELIV
jgi:hypothetical protein